MWTILPAGADTLYSNDVIPPYTGDIDIGIVTALILISLFAAFVIIKNWRRR